MSTTMFIHFPAFAKFIRENHLEEFTKEQLRLCKEVNLPLLRHLKQFSEDELLKLSIEGQIDLLTSIEENRVHERTEKVLKTWEDDEMKIIASEDLALEDIISGVYVRKATFLKFLPYYTSEVSSVLNIISEIDLYEYHVALPSSDTYIKILKRQLDKNTQFIQAITDTVPGAIFVFEPTTYTELYSNHKLLEMVGYNEEEYATVGDLLINMLHQDDVKRVQEAHEELVNMDEGEVRVIDYRVKHKNGNYIWLRTYNSVFKKNIPGHKIQMICAAFNIEEEKRNEEKLLKSQEQLLEAQELCAMGSFILDIESDSIDVTPEFLKIYEIPDLNERYRHVENIHPADRARVIEARDKSIRENTIFDTEYRYIVNNKQKIIWARGIVAMQNGRKVMKGTIMDVTERKHMLHHLQRSETLYKQAQAMAHIGNWTWDLLHNKLDWSEEMYHIYDLQPNRSVEFDDLYKRMHPGDIENVRTIIKAARERNESFDFYYRIIGVNNVEKMLHAKGQVLVDENEKPYKLIGTLQDITKEYHVSRQLEESRAFIQKIANTTPSIITSYNVHSGKYQYVNNSIKKQLGYEINEVLEKGVSFFIDIIHPEDLQQLLKENAEMLERANMGIPANGVEVLNESKYRMKNKSGQYRWFQTYSTVFARNKSGHVEQLLNVSIDITELEVARQELYRKNIALEQSNTNLEEYAYVASHDLKEPLRKISTFGDRLLTTNKENLNDDGKLYLDKMINAAQRMQTMINDLMSISTINSNKTYEKYSLTDVVNEVIIVLEQKIEEKNAIITYDKLPELTMVVSQFRQLFQNLLSNALKFSKRDVNPVINIISRQLSAHEAAAYKLPNIWQYVKIDIADNGIGFEKEYAHRIFTIFQRLHGKSEYEGNGIGLAICKKVVENHNGIIFAESEPGKGAVFSIIVPVEH